MRALDRLPPRREACTPPVSILSLLVTTLLGDRCSRPDCHPSVSATRRRRHAQASAAVWSSNPTHGRAADKFTAPYWFVPDGPCSNFDYSTVQFSWDGESSVATTKLDRRRLLRLATRSRRRRRRVVGVHTASGRRLLLSMRPAGTSATRPLRMPNSTYTVDPTPTMKLTPTKALATAAFTATYKTGQDPSLCAVAAGGSVLLGRRDRSAVRSRSIRPAAAVKQFDAAPIRTASARTRSWPRAAVAPAASLSRRPRAKFTVLPKPTPTRRHADPDPDADADSRRLDLADRDELSAPSPSPTSPTGEVLEATSPPEPSPTPLAAVGRHAEQSSEWDQPVRAGDRELRRRSRPRPIDPAVVGTNLLLTLLVLFLFGADRRDLQQHDGRQPGRGPRLVDAAAAAARSRFWRRSPSPARASLGTCPAPGGSAASRGSSRVLSLLGLIYGFLSPDFGLEPAEPGAVRVARHRARLPDLLLGGLGDAGWPTARYRADASIKLYGTAIIVAILAVIVSRAGRLPAGPRLRLHRLGRDRRAGRAGQAGRRDARPRARPSALLVVSVLAWLLLGPVRVAGRRRRAAAGPGRDRSWR